MDQDDPKLELDVNGICRHCRSYKNACLTTAQDKYNFDQSVKALRESSQPVIVGISGGVDSTYLAWYACKILKLRVILVHVDNGWNTATAVKNIKNTVETLNVDFHNVVLDWREFRLMQLAILKTGVPDLEAPTDLFINYTLRKLAKELNVKTILAGTNPQTEHVMGYNWSYGQRDPVYLKYLYKKCHGDLPKKLPLYHPSWAIYQKLTHGIQIIRPLKYTNYRNCDARNTIIEKVKWQSYERKHGESFITTFYQDYFLPTRFGYDKRKAHYSSLILNAEMTREEALVNLQNDTTSFDLDANIKFFCEKIEITDSEFYKYMNMPKRFHEDYFSIKNTISFKIGKYIKDNLTDSDLMKRIKIFMES